MTRRMLIDATHPEETRVAVVNGTKLEEFDYETEFRKQLKGNIYLAKVTRVEPSLQAAFVEYGGNRHAFLPFPEIHSDYYRIPVGDRPHDETDYSGDASDDQPIPYADPHDSQPDHDYGAGSDPDHDHDHEGSSEAETEAGAEYGRREVQAAHHDDNLISEAFAIVESEEQDHEAENESYSESGDDLASVDQEHESGGEAHSPETVASAPSAETAVETVGGDEVEEMRHRRRSSMPRYKIQEVIKRRQIMLIQVSKEERGNKGAAITTFLSLPGRYCVLMPNTPRGGGVSRKIANPQDRKRLKELMGDLDLPEGMSVILRTAGVERTKTEIKRDLDYLMRLWEVIRDLTLRSTAPALVYEEGNLIKRAIRDIYSRDIDEILVAGEEGYRQAKDFMRMLMPSHARRVQLYRDPVPMFFRYQVETQIDAIHNPVAQLRSGGYIVINQTEALVSIDVNSGRSTRERNIEETAYKTNLEAADEIARQLRLRDMGGLIVIDFIDMEDPRHDSAVERRLKEAMKIDRARIQIGRVSPFGLLELSRQRLHPSLIESSFHTCSVCHGTGIVRSIESAAFLTLRAIEEEGIKGKAAEIACHVPSPIALYILNQKRVSLATLEERYAIKVIIDVDNTLNSPEFRMERLRAHPPGFVPPIIAQPLLPIEDEDEPEIDESDDETGEQEFHGDESPEDRNRRRRRRRGRRRGAPGEDGGQGGPRSGPEGEPVDVVADQPPFSYPETVTAEETAARSDRPSRRRRGRRGGRRTGVAGATTDGGQEEGSSRPEDFSGEDTEWGLQSDFPGDPVADEAALEPEANEKIVESPRHDPVPAPQVVTTFESRRIEPAPPQSAEPSREDQASSPPPQRDYEIVNQTPDMPRQGWWKRLIQ